MDKYTKDARENGVKKLVYADDLVLLGNSWEKVKKVIFAEKSYDRKWFQSRCEKAEAFYISMENCRNGNF